MKWVSLTVDILTDHEIAPLPDHLWRLFMEYQLLCSRSNGPVTQNYEQIGWLLHRDAQEIEQGTRDLIDMDLIEVSPEGRMAPVGWMDQNAAYINKLAYNRDRYHKKEGSAVLDKTTEEAWDDLVQGAGTPPAGEDSLGKLVKSAEVGTEWRSWAVTWRVLDNAPLDIVHASYILAESAGMLPYSSRKSWYSAISDLLDACGRDFDVLSAAVHKAATDREVRGITLSSPRSFQGYARNEAATRRMAARKNGNQKEANDGPIDLASNPPGGVIDL